METEDNYSAVAYRYYRDLRRARERRHIRNTLIALFTVIVLFALSMRYG
jgi:hypothetical protein